MPDPLYVYINEDAHPDLYGAVGTLEPKRPGWETTSFRTGNTVVQLYPEQDLRPFDHNWDRVCFPRVAHQPFRVTNGAFLQDQKTLRQFAPVAERCGHRHQRQLQG